MTDKEKQDLLEAIKRNAPKWYERIKERINQKKTLISNCIGIASHSDNEDYQNEINRMYNTDKSLLNETETILLNYVCLIRHKEHINTDIHKDDAEIQKWLLVLERYIESEDAVISILKKTVRKIIHRYKIKSMGRPTGKGKRIFSYKGKDYHTIQECANDYGISKQGMYMRLRKLNII